MLRAPAFRNGVLVLGSLLLAVVMAPVSTSDAGATASTPVERAPVTVVGNPLATFADSGADHAVGKPIPTLEGQSLFDGSTMTIGPTGKPQVLMFVAHWCPHCQREVPLVAKLAKHKKLFGADVATVATGTVPNYPNYPPSAWLERVHWPFPVMADSTKFDGATAFGLSSYPYFVFVDAKGKVAGRASGEIPSSQLKQIVAALLAGKKLAL
jgi:thiol-disulfide isomerase/thioredoxin